MVRHIVFEAVFINGIPPDEAMARALAEAGFDIKAPRPEYSLEVMGRCIDVAIAARFANVPREDALKAVGGRFIAGILGTMLGKVVGVAVLVTGPDRTTRRIPALTKSDYGLELTVTKLGPNHYEVVSSGETPVWAGAFFAGLYEEAMRRTNVVPRALLRRKEAGFAFDLTWTT